MDVMLVLSTVAVLLCCTWIVKWIVECVTRRRSRYKLPPLVAGGLPFVGHIHCKQIISVLLRRTYFIFSRNL